MYLLTSVSGASGFVKHMKSNGRSESAYKPYKLSITIRDPVNDNFHGDNYE